MHEVVLLLLICNIGCVMSYDSSDKSESSAKELLKDVLEDFTEEKNSLVEALLNRELLRFNRYLKILKREKNSNKRKKSTMELNPKGLVIPRPGKKELVDDLSEKKQQIVEDEPNRWSHETTIKQAGSAEKLRNIVKRLRQL